MQRVRLRTITHRLRAMAGRFWPVMLLALMTSGLAAVGWRHAGTVALRAAQAGLAAAWPLLWVGTPALLIIAATSLAVTVRSNWRHGVTVRSTWIMAGFAVLAMGLVVGIIVWFPALLIDRGQRRLAPTERHLSAEQWLKAESDVRTSLLQAVAGLVVVAGAGATWRQLHINREGQITERFGRAIDHLGQAGEDKLDVRLGGIYTMERIALNSRADRATIAEVLTAHLRERAPWPPVRPGQYREMAPIEEIPTLQVRAGDLQAILTVLGRRKHPPHGPVILNLAITDLRGADLAHADLQGANLWGANLQGARLVGANLRGAILTSANLERAALRGANLQGANLMSANLQDADLRQAKLQHAFLWFAKLQGANLCGADLQHAHLTRTNLQGAALIGANLQGAGLGNANLCDANLLNTNLQNAYLGMAILDKAEFMGAKLQGAKLLNASLQGAILDHADLQGAWTTAQTSWPTGFDWRQAGVELTDEEVTAE